MCGRWARMMWKESRAKTPRSATWFRWVYSHPHASLGATHGQARDWQQLNEKSTRSEAGRFFPPLGAYLGWHPRGRGAVWDLRRGSRADGIRGWIVVLYSWRASYLPHRGEQRRATGPAPPAQNRLERQRGLHGRRAGRKGTGYLRQAQPRCRFRQFRRFDRPVVRGDCDWQGGCRFGIGPALAQT